MRAMTSAFAMWLLCMQIKICMAIFQNLILAGTTLKTIWANKGEQNEAETILIWNINIKPIDETCGETEYIKIKYSMKKEIKNARTKRN